MTRTRKAFLLLLLTGPIHMAEQMVTGIEEFHMIRRTVINPYYSWFPADQADFASVLLITIVGAILSFVFYALAAGGTLRTIALTVFALLGIGEIHHLVEALTTTAYDPGVITSLAYCWYGCSLLSALWDGSRSSRMSTVLAEPSSTSLA
jgi:hypothetical protein